MISIAELENLKKEALELKESQKGKITLEGKNKIILTTSILDDKKTTVSSAIKNYNGIKENEIDDSYLDALVKYFNEKYEVHGMVNYFPLQEEVYKNLNNLYIGRYYCDEKFKEYLRKIQSDLFIHLKFGSYNYEKEVFIREGMSSFSFMGCSGISLELKKLYLNRGIDANTGFGGTITKGEFLEDYHFTDDTINYCSKYDLEPLRYKKLSRDMMWPRTLEITFKKYEQLEANLEAFAILGDFLQEANEKFTSEEIYEVYSPMKVKK